jgi:hypothetical protein
MSKIIKCSLCKKIENEKDEIKFIEVNILNHKICFCPECKDSISGTFTFMKNIAERFYDKKNGK